MAQPRLTHPLCHAATPFMVTDRCGTVTIAAVDDFALLQAWRAGDRGAGDALVRRHYRSVLRFFELRTRYAEDLTQRTFLACVEGRERLRNDAGFRAYLFGIARNHLLRYFDDQRRDDRLASFDEPTAGPGPGMTTIVANREEAHLLLRALAALNHETQTLIVLQYWEGLSPTEIAAVFDMPPSTVRTQLARARQALHDTVHATSSPVRRAVEEGLDGWIRALAHDAGAIQIPVAPKLADRNKS